MTRAIACSSLLVPQHDAAIDFFTRVLPRELLQDTPELTAKHRAVVSPGQRDGQVWLRLVNDDCDDNIQHLTAHVVRRAERLPDEDDGCVVVFLGRWGKRRDGIETRCR